MALIKTIGDASYWRISGNEVCVQNSWAKIVVFGWTNIDSRRANDEPLVVSEYVISDDDFTFDSEILPVSEVYEKMKIKGDWIGAQDA